MFIHTKRGVAPRRYFRPMRSMLQARGSLLHEGGPGALVPRFWRHLLPGAIACLPAACDSSPVDRLTPRSAPSAVRLSAVVRSDDATGVSVRVFYRRGEAEVDLAKTTIQFPATSAAQISVDIAQCLADAQQSKAAHTTCLLSAELILVRGGLELDRTVLGPVAAQPGETVVMPTATLSEVATVDIIPSSGVNLSAEPETTVVLK